LVGFFVNTLVLRTDTSGNPTFAQLLGRVRERALNAYANQDLPFEYLVEQINPSRSASRHPLFQVMLAFNNNVPAGLDLPGIHATGQPVPANIAKFDLTLGLSEQHDPHGNPAGITGGLQYATDLFDEVTVRRLVGHLLRLLEQVVADPRVRVGEVE